MASNLSYAQAYTILNSVYSQATGQAALANIDSADWVSVATTTMKTGYDNVLKAIGQVLAKTIYSVRPYNSRFKSLSVSEQTFGGIRRKISYFHMNAEKNAEFPYTPEDSDDPLTPHNDGDSIDQWTINKPKPIQMMFYGGDTYARHITRYKDQLDVAFSSPEELSRFWAGAMTELSNDMEQDHEVMKRMCLSNLVGSVLVGGTGYQVIHLLTEYNTATGLSLTATTVMQPTNFKPFCQWVFARINKACRMLEERTVMFHQNLTAGNFLRHTPMASQKIFMLEDFKEQIDTMALADTYHDNYLKLATNEGVAFWQSPLNPDKMHVTPEYLKSDGSTAKYTDDIEVSKLLGIIMDENAAGVATINKWEMQTPMNARGGYSNLWFHFTDQYWNDPTENVLLLFLD